MIAKHTSSLCNACRLASSKTTNPVAKRQFVQSAKDVANSTAKLVKEIKALDQDYSRQNRDNCAAATQPLMEAVENLCTFANSPDFASIPAKISPAARQAQEPITSAGKIERLLPLDVEYKTCGTKRLENGASTFGNQYYSRTCLLKDKLVWGRRSTLAFSLLIYLLNTAKSSKMIFVFSGRRLSILL